MRLILLATCLILYTALTAQNLPQPEGKWRVVIVEDDDIQWDLRTNQIKMGPELSRDTALAREILEDLMQIYGAFIMDFGEKGRFAILVDNKINRSGNYRVDSRISQIHTTTFRNGEKTVEIYKYRFHDGMLILTLTDEDDYELRFTLEKAE